MVRVTEPDSGRVMTDAGEVRAFLAEHGIWYRRFEGSDGLREDATDEEILAAYREPIAELRAEGGYTTADVIDVTPDTPGLDEMLAKFAREHWHDEDEVRFVVGGRGIFHVHPENGAPFAIQVGTGDMINVPARTLHWFHLCEDRTIRAIRLFLDPAGWTPRYTDSGIDARYEPVCFGPADVP